MVTILLPHTEINDFVSQTANHEWVDRGSTFLLGSGTVPASREELWQTLFRTFSGVLVSDFYNAYAIKSFALLRNVIRGSSTPKGMREYAILLSICETCKYKGISFLDFLHSGKSLVPVVVEFPKMKVFSYSENLVNWETFIDKPIS